MLIEKARVLQLYGWDMAETGVSYRPGDDRELISTDPETDSPSKTVMLRAERGDCVEVSDIVNTIGVPESFPRTFDVIQRTETYHGPVLLLEADDEEFQITAPGPDFNLLLWASILDDDGSQIRWRKAAEVCAKIVDRSPYQLCDNCGRPIRTTEHKRLSAIQKCDSLPERYQ